MKLEIESEKVLEAAKKCPEWREGLETLFPEAFEKEDKYFDFSKAKIEFTPPPDMHANSIQILNMGEFHEKGFFLSTYYHWNFQKIEPPSADSYYILIPTKKEK